MLSWVICLNVAAATQRGQRQWDIIVGEHARLREALMQRLLTGSAFYCTNASLAIVVQLICRFCRDQELLAGDKIRRGKIDDLRAFWGDGDIGNDKIGFT